MWVANRAAGTVARVAVREGALERRVAAGRAPAAVALGVQLAWVAQAGDDTVARLDRASGDVVGDPIGVGRRPSAVYVGGDGVWVANTADATLSRIDVASAAVLGAPIPVGTRPVAVQQVGPVVWVANAGDGTVSRIDARTGRPAGPPVRVGREPVALAHGGGACGSPTAATAPSRAWTPRRAASSAPRGGRRAPRVRRLRRGRALGRRPRRRHGRAGGAVSVAELPLRPPRAPLPEIGASRRVAPGRVLAVASAGAGLAFVDATIVNVAFPDMQADFAGTSFGALSWILNAYNIVFAAFLVAAGRLADLLGRRRMFHVGVVLFTLASAACAAAPTVETLVAARVLQALGAAITVPASLALVLNAYPPAERAHGVALWTAGAALAAGLGPSLGGALVELGGWRLAFLVNLPLGVAALAAGRRTLVESRAPGRRTLPDLAGAGVAALAIGALTLGHRAGGGVGLDERAGAGRVRRGAAARRRLRAPLPPPPVPDARPRPAADPHALRGERAERRRRGGLLRLRAQQRPLPHGRVALLRARRRPRALGRPVRRRRGGAAGQPARRAARAPPALLVAGGLLWAAGLAYMATRVGTQPAFVAEWLPGMLLLGVGAGLTFPLLSGAAVASAPGERFATATSLSSVEPRRSAPSSASRC